MTVHYGPAPVGSRQIPQGAAEVIVIAEEVLLNGPDHKSLGYVHAGDCVLVADGLYAQSLVDDDLVVFARDFPDGLDDAALELQLLDRKIAAAEQEDEEDEEHDSPPGPGVTHTLVPESSAKAKSQAKRPAGRPGRTSK